ncbi:multidrug efflux pump [Pseudoxanthobacter soli DSM 19599]|uniref:Multidrug efflux pump n=1 Tax=Pseudoxanthobacter soli DSM 19599 TaxID=1123029 RepID=A0A1M7ZL27_9HYPH|nr:efflux RND transporter permease subunit [Pseudoxanthobacter soli]SHO65588.1 multidrug efflux pump [Pseudoxanthobacter soli DSM 19599]
MNLSAPFIRRPVATTLLTVAVIIAGLLGYRQLPVAPLPNVEFPTIMVQAQMAGASPETMATSVAGVLERYLGQIAGVTEMTSQSSSGNTRIVLQFDLSRDIEGAAKDVQAAINASRTDLPSSLRSNPTYRKFNPADAPILILALSSPTRDRGQIYDTAATILQQKLSQVEGVGNVDVNGASLPAVRVELNPHSLAKYGIALEDVRAALASANANSPKGIIESSNQRWQIYANDQASKAADYRDITVAVRNGAAIKLTDVASVIDSVEDVRNAGFINGDPAVLLTVYNQPGANVIETVDRVRAVLPQLRAALPGDVTLTETGDRSVTIRASFRDTQRALVIAVLLVVGVVFVFLGSLRAAIIPSVAVPTSIIGTFGLMALAGYSLDNFSLMALTIATGFVVDDAIVVLENISRRMEEGETRLVAALNGAKEVGFTVLSMSLSLIAVFLPLLVMGGIIGRLFEEFSITLSMAIAISLVISLTTTPMMCAVLLPRERKEKRPGLGMRAMAAAQRGYDRSLGWVLGHPRLVLTSLLITIVLNVVLYAIVPKGFMPPQDTGLLMGGIRADSAISFTLMQQKLRQVQQIVASDPGVDQVIGSTGGRTTNSANVFITLKPRAERDSADAILARLRPKLAEVPGARLFMFSRQDLRVGGRQSLAQYQYTLQGDDTRELDAWSERLVQALRHEPSVTDVNSDQEEGGLQMQLVLDRTTAARYGLSPDVIDATLYDAFGQRSVSTIHSDMNEYRVIMELAPEFLTDPSTLDTIYVSGSGARASGSSRTNSTTSSSAATAGSDAATAVRNQATNAIATGGSASTSSGAAVSTRNETMIPLSAFAHYEPGRTPTQIRHQGQFASATISFNLTDGASLGDAVAAIDRAAAEIHLPTSIQGSFSGTAATFQSTSQNQPLLILAALVTIYIVLGVLYESYVHPITILSTLPSAGVGAVLALLVSGTEFSVIALIGVILLIGIVKKNAIMMVDFALQAERNEGLAPLEAIHRAAVQRFRPIMMTTLAALLGALPLALDFGEGGEIRRPLGIAIIGGLIVSQLLTLYTTPVVYLTLDRLRLRSAAKWRSFTRGNRRAAS